jgi:hypothetical protein
VSFSSSPAALLTLAGLWGVTLMPHTCDTPDAPEHACRRLLAEAPLCTFRCAAFDCGESAWYTIAEGHEVLRGVRNVVLLVSQWLVLRSVHHGFQPATCLPIYAVTCVKCDVSVTCECDCVIGSGSHKVQEDLPAISHKTQIVSRQLEMQPRKTLRICAWGAAPCPKSKSEEFFVLRGYNLSRYACSFCSGVGCFGAPLIC